MRIINCECGWKTMYRKDDIVPPSKCEACGKEGTLEETKYVAEMIATIVFLRDERVSKHARAHGYLVYKPSPKRYVVLRDNGFSSTVTYNDKQARAYPELTVVAGPCTWSDAMKFIRNNTPPLPEYLTR